jgi:hypothetical protein
MHCGGSAPEVGRTNLRQCHEALELHGLALCKGAHALHALLIVLRGRTRTV